MTSQGTAHGRFQRAIHRRHLLAAEMAAREMGGLSLADALLLCELLANVDPATLRVLLAQIDVDRFRITSFDNRIQAHRAGPYSPSRGAASVSTSRRPCFGGRVEARRAPLRRATSVSGGKRFVDEPLEPAEGCSLVASPSRSAYGTSLSGAGPSGSRSSTCLMFRLCRSTSGL
jgi:hypothetical protein